MIMISRLVIGPENKIETPEEEQEEGNIPILDLVSSS